MYGEAIDTPRKETDILNPLTAYARSKVWAEQELKNLSDEGFQVTALRFATACGASPKLRLDLVLNDFVASAILYKTIEVLSDGTPWRPLIHVEDMARAICWALGRKKGGAFAAVNVGSDEWTYQVRELAEIVGHIIPGTTLTINTEGTSSPDKRSYKVDFSLFQQLAPDHQPVTTIGEAIRGLEAQISSLSFNEGVHFRKSTPYMRLNTLEQHIRLGLMDEQLFWKIGSA
jgi:nucleoside-diphosphate-sugar epimerase